MHKGAFFTSQYLLLIFLRVTAGLKCELRGLVDNRVQCILHDRGINAEESAAYRIGNQWISNIRSSKTKVELEPWRYSAGLDRNHTGDDAADFKKHIRKIIADTRWCGDVDREKSLSYEDLAYFMKTDKCCKKHESCISTMEPEQTKYGLSNVGLLKRFHCDCEKEFYDCLKSIRNALANKIGFTYFTVFGPQCFKEEYSVINCTLKNKINRCVKYALNKTEEKKYQWFDIPMY